MILDSYGGTGSGQNQCYQKTDYRGDPHEWGAYGDGSTDDTFALQNWLGAYGNVNPTLAPATAPPNFGPWIASVPANYLVSQPLVCPPYANLQAGANIGSGIPGNGGGPANPLVRIVAAPPNQQDQAGLANTLGLPALMMAGPYCRISGIAIDANGNGDFLFPGLAGSVSGTTVTLSTEVPSGVVTGMPLYDTGTGSGPCIPKGAAITAINGNALTISIAATNSCGSTDSITITGFYAVDVMGTHVGIDNHSLVERGFHNVHCADSQLDGLQLKDAQFYKSYDTGVYLTGNCDNVRAIGDIIQNSGRDGSGSGLYFSGSDLSLEGGIVEQTGGRGIYLSGADLVVISGMTLAANGNAANPATNESYPYPAVQIDGSSDITITGSWIKGTGTDTPNGSSGLIPLAADILFTGTSDNVSIAGNVYPPIFDSAGNALPAYIYDAEPATTSSPAPKLTNTHIYETAEQPAVSVFSPNAQPLLAPLVVPQFTQNQIAGLTLSNGSTGSTLTISPGSAADSTNSTIIQEPQGCPLDLKGNGGDIARSS